MRKPNLTKTQKQNFEKALNQIITAASPTVQKEWQKNGGRVQWMEDIPIMFGIESKLTGRLADQWVTLMNNLNDRRL